jgi:hypothetical protein
LILAIDPGARGGAAYVDPNGDLAGWACWRPAKGGYRVWSSHRAPALAEHMSDVVDSLPRCAVVVVEELHLRPGIRASSILTLAETTGETIGALRLLWSLCPNVRPAALLAHVRMTEETVSELQRPNVTIHRVSPVEWSREIGGTSGGRLTERAVAALRRSQPADRIPGASVGSPESVGAVAEAWLMGRFQLFRG